MLISENEFKRIASKFCKDNIKSILETVSEDLDASEIKDLTDPSKWKIHGLFSMKEHAKEAKENYPNQIGGFCEPFDDRFDIYIKSQDCIDDSDEYECYDEKITNKFEGFTVELTISY